MDESTRCLRRWSVWWFDILDPAVVKLTRHNVTMSTMTCHNILYNPEFGWIDPEEIALVGHSQNTHTTHTHTTTIANSPPYQPWERAMMILVVVTRRRRSSWWSIPTTQNFQQQQQQQFYHRCRTILCHGPEMPSAVGVIVE